MPQSTRVIVTELEALRTRLASTWELRIVSREGEASGVFRIPDVNTGARNYYLIVEAVTPDGRCSRARSSTRRRAAPRRSRPSACACLEEVYDAVRRDKSDDGIIQDNVVGEKPRGALDPVYTMPVMGGMITRW
jgi:hypothetical protein